MMRRVLLAICAWLALSGAATAADRHVVLVTIDGLRPEFYLADGWPAPNLRALVQAGAHARAAEPVFPSVTYPNHASIATGVRPARHGVATNFRFDPDGAPASWHLNAADLSAPPVWQWARAAGLSTGAVSWPSTVGADIDALVPEQDYFARPEPLPLLRGSSTPGLFERLGVTPEPDMFRDPARWDAFVTETAAAIIRRIKPHLLLVHLVEADYRQHRDGLDDGGVRAALGRVDAGVGVIARALREAGLAGRAAVMVAGDHGFAAVQGLAFPNAVLARAGLRGCPRPGAGWTATAHISGAAAAVHVNPRGDAAVAARAEAALRAGAAGRYVLVSRSELDRLGALPEAAFALEAAPGYTMGGSCERGLTGTYRGGAHGYLPSRPEMATGFVAAGAGVRAGVSLERVWLIDIAPTAARLLGLTPPPVEGRVLAEILESRSEGGGAHLPNLPPESGAGIAGGRRAPRSLGVALGK
jgi:predicted AlkP superfamily pyrophosphatase or phosphodiesterase